MPNAWGIFSVTEENAKRAKKEPAKRGEGNGLKIKVGGGSDERESENEGSPSFFILGAGRFVKGQERKLSQGGYLPIWYTPQVTGGLFAKACPLKRRRTGGRAPT